MKLDVHVSGKKVASLYKDRDEYILTYLPQADPADFISLAMPVRAESWRWPRDLHPFFRQNLPEGYLLSIIREEFGPLLDGTDLSLLAVVGGTGIGRVLIVKRFDVDEHGAVTHGVEDACSLLGLPPHEKYVTTTLNDVAYTPVYDVVTTQAYPRYATNPPGLPVDGRQTWARGKTLERFFNARLGIPPKQYAEMVEQLCESAVEVGLEVIEAAKNNSQWHSVAKNMVHAWNEGMASLRSPKSQVLFKGLTHAIADAGFSDADKPENE